jgi:C-terminal processing protease CtpA/Prc
VLAAALQAVGRAQVVGTTTPGNTETIFGYDFADGSRLWLAQEGFRLPSGVNLEGRGVVPDAIVDVDWTTFSDSDDPQIVKALELLGQTSKE